MEVKLSRSEKLQLVSKLKYNVDKHNRELLSESVKVNFLVYGNVFFKDGDNHELNLLCLNKLVNFIVYNKLNYEINIVGNYNGEFRNTYKLPNIYNEREFFVILSQLDIYNYEDLNYLVLSCFNKDVFINYINRDIEVKEDDNVYLSSVKEIKILTDDVYYYSVEGLVREKVLLKNRKYKVKSVLNLHGVIYYEISRGYVKRNIEELEEII